MVTKLEEQETRCEVDQASWLPSFCFQFLCYSNFLKEKKKIEDRGEGGGGVGGGEEKEKRERRNKSF